MSQTTQQQQQQHIPSSLFVELLHRSFQLATDTKMFHWQTHRYSQHKTSDMLFEELLDKMDEMLEVGQGLIGKRLHFQNSHTSIQLRNVSKKQMVTDIKEFIHFFNKLPYLKKKKLVVYPIFEMK